jgi:tRNA(fMet)-specific endonuclease VapC
VATGAERGILDTSTVILLERITDISLLPGEPMITAVTLAELSAGPLLATDPAEQATRQVRLQQAEADFDPLPFDAAAARSLGRVAASLHGAGRKTRARAYDAMIAAVALSNDLPLFTCNPADFEHIDQLDLRPIPHPSA